MHMRVNGYICFLQSSYMRIKTLISTLLLFVSLFSNAQFQKGDRMAGASIASVFYNNTTADVTITSIGSTHSINKNYAVNINPQYGWFISEKTAVGVLLNINPSGQKVRYEENGIAFQEDKTTTLNLGAGGFIRSYFSNKGSFLPFGQAVLNVGISKQETSGFFYSADNSTSYKMTYAGKSSGGFYMNGTLLAGVTRKINETIGFDLYLGYNYSYTKNSFNRSTSYDEGIDGSIDNTLKSESSSKYTNNGVLLGVGLQVFLKGK